jgi:small-conductance mechanosensitive channel
MVFEEIIQKLSELGFYNFLLPFIIVSAILYAILRKTKVLGESPLINGIVSIAVSFFIFGLPVLTGTGGFGKPMSNFFSQLIVVVLIIAFGLLVAGLFVPNLMEKMMEWMKGSAIIWVIIIIVVLLAISSGLFSFIASPIQNALGSGGDTFIVILIVLIAVGIIAAASAGGKK